MCTNLTEVTQYHDKFGSSETLRTLCSTWMHFYVINYIGNSILIRELTHIVQSRELCSLLVLLGFEQQANPSVGLKLWATEENCFERIDREWKIGKENRDKIRELEWKHNCKPAHRQVTRPAMGDNVDSDLLYDDINQNIDNNVNNRFFSCLSYALFRAACIFLFSQTIHPAFSLDLRLLRLQWELLSRLNACAMLEISRECHFNL